MTRKTSVLASFAILISGACIWHFGWVYWDLECIWENMHNMTYQNLLLAIIFAYVSSALLVWHWKADRERGKSTPSLAPNLMTDPSIKSSPPVSPKNPTNLEKKIDEILTKQTDTHAIIKFLKNSESHKTPNKAKIPLELPEEAEEALKKKSGKALVKIPEISESPVASTTEEGS